MKKQHSTHHTGSGSIVVAGDDRLTGEFLPLLEAQGFALLRADDAKAIASADGMIFAGLELSVSADSIKKERLLLLDAHLPPSAMIISSSVTVAAARQASWMNHPERLIGCGAFPALMSGPLVEIAIPVRTKESTVRAAIDFFARLGKEAVVVQDRVGMIFPGILAQVINEALIAVRQNVASAEAIDAAMKSGAGYPLGPIEWGETIGFAHVASLLDAMREETGEERFRVAPLLRQLSLSGKFWKEKIVRPEPVQEILPLDEAPRDAGASAPDADGTKQKRKRGK